MKVLTVVLLFFFAAVSLRAELVFHFDFEGKPGSSGNLDDATGRNFFVRFRENSSSKRIPMLVADTPEALAERSRTSVRINRGLSWLKSNRGQSIPLRQEFTFNFWLRPDDSLTGNAWFFVANKSFRLGYQNKMLFFQNAETGEKAHSENVSLPGERWQMITLTYSKGELGFYLNAEKAGSARLLGDLSNSEEIFLGNSSAHGRDYFEGRIDDFAVWDQVLSGEEIALLYKGKSPGAVAGGTERLYRTRTSSFPADFQAYEPVRRLSLLKEGQPNAVIVRTDNGGTADLERQLQQHFAAAWGLTLPIAEADEALKSGRTLILFGRANGNMPLRRLTAFMQIAKLQSGSELRVFPTALDWESGAVFCGGDTPEAVLESAKRLTARFPDPRQLEFTIDREKFRDQPVPENFRSEQTAAMRQHYRTPPDYIPNQSAIRLFRPAFHNFANTGREEYARTFAELQKIYLENYDGAINDRGTPPSFTFQEFPMMLELIEHSPAFTAEDRARAAEIIRRVLENCLDYWEMAAPMTNYEKGRQPYYTNHPIFASRSVYFGAEYLWRRYQFPPAAYQLAVAENALAGIAPHPIGPEDSAAYQYICYRLFIEYALASGKYDLSFFKNESFQNYLKYCKMQFHHHGSTAGYGDNQPLYLSNSFPILGYAVDLFADREAESLLSLILRNTPNQSHANMIRNLGIPNDLPLQMGDDSLGLNCFYLDDFRLEQRKAAKPGFPALDKALFRSGWDENADFLAVSGISSAPHGHQDANSILLYLRGEHYWLVEGDYIRKQPEEHNTVTLAVNGETVRPTGRDPACFARVLNHLQNPAREMALLQTMIPDYGNSAWQRTICYEAGLGFWCLDEIEVKTPAEMLLECRWRLLGEFGRIGTQAVELLQKESTAKNDPAAFSVIEGSGAKRRISTQFDYGHSGKDGYYADYPQAGPLTRVITQYRQGKFSAGERLRFTNFLLPHQPGSQSVPEIRQLADQAYLAVSEDGVRLAVSGSYQGNGIHIEAGHCFIGPAGIVATNAGVIAVGDFVLKFDEPRQLALDRSAVTPQLTAALRQIARTAPPVPFTPSEMAAAEELPVHQVKLPGAATALAASADGLFGVGTDTGKVLVFDGGGAVQWEAEFSGPVSALAAIPGGNGETRWAVGEIPAEASDTGKLHLLSGSGERQWSADTSPYQGRNGTIRTIFPAQFALNSLPVVVAGDDGWHYRAFDWNGKELWKRQIYHGATVGVAADLTGDRLDEIVAGSEYYYHQLLDRNGKVLIQKNTDPFTLAIGIIDLDSDGRAEALCGRSDGKIHVMAPTEERIGQFSALPVGGQPVGIVPCRSTGGGLFAVATANGRLVFGDARMQAVNSVQFDCGFYGLIRQQDVLLLPATDGYVYRADFSGRITGRYRCGYDPGQVSPPRPVSAGETAAAAAGDTLYLLK